MPRRAIERGFCCRLAETEAGVRRTIAETRRTFCKTDAEWGNGHLFRQGGRSGTDQDNIIFSSKSGARQHEKLRKIAHPFGASLAPPLAMLAVAVQRDRAADRVIGAEPLLTVFDPEFLVKESPPDHDRLASQLGIHPVSDARHRQRKRCLRPT